MEPGTADLAPIVARIDAIAGQVSALVDGIVELRETLDALDLLLPDQLAYRLAAVLSRVDHAAAEVVITQARRQEAKGQLAAFPEPEA